MRLSKADAARRPGPRRKPLIGGFVWLAGAASLLAASLGATASALGSYPVAPERRFAGVLTAGTDARLVAVSPNLPVSEFVVRDGDFVSEGQVIAQYDRRVLQQQIDALDARTRTARLHRDCLIGLFQPDEGLLIATTKGHEERQALRIVLRSCALERATVRQTSATDLAERDRRAAELALLDLQLTRPPSNSLAGSGSVRSRLAISRSVLANRLREGELRLGSNRITLAQALLGKARQLSDEIRGNLAERERLMDARDSLGLTAPDSGVLTITSSQADGGPLAEIRGADSAPLTAEVFIPESDLGKISLTAPVAVSFQSDVGSETVLTGTISGVLRPVAGTMLRVVVAVDTADSFATGFPALDPNGAPGAIAATLRFPTKSQGLAIMMTDTLSDLVIQTIPDASAKVVRPNVPQGRQRPDQSGL